MIGVEVPSPPVTVEHGGGGGGWVEIVRATDDIDAHLLLGRLEEAGIEARTVKDRRAPGAWLYGGSNPWAPVVILVRRIQADDARIVLAEISFEAPAASPSRTGAPALELGPKVLYWTLAVVLGIVLTGVALGATVRALEARYACDVPILCAGGR
jgi:hypothetical protein